MANNELPTQNKMSFAQRLRLLFNPSSLEEMLANAREQGLQEGIETGKEIKEEELAEKIERYEAQLHDVQHVAKTYTEMYEGAEKRAKAAEERADKAENQEKVKIDTLTRKAKEAGEVKTDKGINAAEMTLYFKQNILAEKEKYEAALAEIDGIDGSLSVKFELAEKYQGKILGMLYAYTEFDRSTDPVVLTHIRNLIHDQVKEGSEDVQKSFMNGYMVTRYSESYYEDMEAETYFQKNEAFFKGDKGKLITPETENRVGQYYKLREDFTVIEDKLPRVGKNDAKAKSTETYTPDLVGILNENAGHNVRVGDDEEERED